MTATARAIRMFGIQPKFDSMRSRRETAKLRGQLYLEYAQQAFDRDDLSNALSYVDEGIALTDGPFYLAVREQLEDLRKKIVTGGFSGK